MWWRLPLLALAALLPFVLEGYELYRVTLACVYALAVMGLSLLIGLSGQFSIGHSAFFALGAYAVAVPVNSFSLSPYVALMLAAPVGFAAGYIVGWPARRLGFVHLALVTWGLALAVPQLLKSSHLEPWTRGVQGIYVNRPDVPAGVPVSDDQWWYWITLSALALFLYAGENIRRGRDARAMRALKDNPVAASASGVAAARYIPLAFGISAAYTALAGGLAALLTDFVAPDSYGVFFSILLLVGAVAGGVGSVWGALAGGALIQYLPDLAADASAALSLPAYGLLLIAIIYLMPTGLSGLINRLETVVRRRFYKS